MSKIAFQPLKKSRLYEEVADKIKQAIYDGQLKPGDRLPPERELCQMFDVGRPTIREALRTLSVVGLVEVNHGAKGSVIKEYDVTQYMETMREHLSWLIKTDRKTLVELWEVRKYLELGIAHSAAINATKSELKQLEKLLKKMEACQDDIEEVFRLGVQFHEQLALVTRNKMFYLTWKIIHGVILKGYPPLLKEAFKEGGVVFLESDGPLLEAIKSKDPTAIDQAQEKHATAEVYLSSMSPLESRTITTGKSRK